MPSPNPGSVIHPDGRGRRDASGKPKEKNRRRPSLKDGSVSKDEPVSAKRNPDRKSRGGSKKSVERRNRNRAKRRAALEQDKADRLMRRNLQMFAVMMQKAMRREIGRTTKKKSGVFGLSRKSPETSMHRRRRAYAKYYFRCLQRNRLPTHVPEWFHDMKLWQEAAGAALA